MSFPEEPDPRTGKGPEHERNARGKAKISNAEILPVMSQNNHDYFLDPINYKTVEEFVEAHGEVFYHGTSELFTQFDPKKIGLTQGFKESGFHFTDDKGYAKRHASTYPQKAKYKWTEEDRINAQKSIIIEVYFPKDDVLTLNDLIQLYEDGKIKNKPVTEGLFRPESVVDNNREAIEEAFDVTNKSIFRSKMEGTTNYLVSDTSLIKTKAQLIEMWKNTHKIK